MSAYKFLRQAVLAGLLVAAAGCRTGGGRAESLQAVIGRELSTTNGAGEVSGGHEAAYEEMDLLVETIMLVKRGYVRDIPFRDLLYGSLNGMLLALDPHSAFLGPRGFEALREDAHGSFSGVGMTIGADRGGLVVIAPIEDSPSFRQGVLAGDSITAINGESTENMSIDSAVSRLRGDSGTSVRVTFRRDGGDPFDVSIVREEIRIASIKGARILHDGLGYVRITQFGEKTPEEFAKALDGLRQQGLRGLVIDLRGDPGGLLESAVEIVQHFLPSHATVVTLRGREGEKNERVFRAGGADHDMATPLVVLINRGSASASEIMAGALQDHKRAMLVGETSFGKASVQNVVPLQTRPECAVKLTTAFYYTPGNRLIHGKGIAPCVTVPMKPEEWRRAQLKRMYDELPAAFPVEKREPVADAADPQLEKGLALLLRALAEKDLPPAEALLGECAPEPTAATAAAGAANGGDNGPVAPEPAVAP